MKGMMKYFFLTGHVQYARYITQYLIKMHGHTEDNDDLVCVHHYGYWNAVSLDQFDEQTAIRIKGMPLSADLVSEWINAFPIT